MFVCCWLYSEEECLTALNMFNGRWYAQRQLSCEMSPVTKWKPAICGVCVCVCVLACMRVCLCLLNAVCCSNMI